MPNNHSVGIKVNGENRGDTLFDVAITIDNDRIPEDDHIEVKITSEGIIIERWNDYDEKFTASRMFLYAEDFFAKTKEGATSSDCFNG